MIMFSFNCTQQNEHFRILLTNAIAHWYHSHGLYNKKKLITKVEVSMHRWIIFLSIYHTDAKKLVYFFQYTKKCSEIKLAMHDFV